MLPGCGSHRGISRAVRNLETNHMWQTLEAKWFDLPIPFDVRRSSLSELKQGGYHICYLVSHATLESLSQWYLHEMEVHGWYKTAEYSSLLETVLTFEKPTKRCLIVLKSEHASIILSIFYRELSEQEIIQLKQDKY